ncbi:MAG TPA: leucyl/phenylalanyl-tRNA--protein transferase [Rectinemataceae bacterium]
MLISAYSQGVFPWYSEGEPILWWSPDPRFVVLPNTLHWPRRSRRQARHQGFDLTVDRDFPGVINACASAPRKGQDGTWITDEMIAAYTVLHRLGLAHSVEVWKESALVGGLYGVSLGSAFFGESMFSHVSGASRFAFLELAEALFSRGFSFIDSQVRTEYLESMGGIHIPRGDYLSLLSSALETPSSPGSWSESFPGIGRYFADSRLK